MSVKQVAVLVSGGGSNLEALLKAQTTGALTKARIELVISSRKDAYALQRAEKYKVPSLVIEPKTFSTDEAFQAAILDALVKAKIDVVCLAGYLRKIGTNIVRHFRGKMINIHPALLPKFGGPGMYGHHVHEAVIAAGEKESGCTIHLVDEEYDHGAVLAQARVRVLPKDTPEDLAARVLEQEHQLYPKILQEFCASL